MDLTPVQSAAMTQGPPGAKLEQRAEGLRQLSRSPTSEHDHVREAFTQFVGETFYLQMLKAMRTSLGEPAYFHGGRAEEVFTSQLDQTLAEELADKSTERFIEPLFEQQFPGLAREASRAQDGPAPPPGRSLDALHRW